MKNPIKFVICEKKYDEDIDIKNFENRPFDLIVPLEHSTRLSQEVWSRINATDTPLLGSYDKSSDPRFQKSTLFAKQWLKDLGSEVTDKLYEFYKADFALLNYSNFTHPDFPLPLHGLH